MKSRKSRRHLVIACLAAGIGLGAAAQNPSATWRCGNTYTDQPCQGGKAVKMVKEPSATQVRDADASMRQLQADAQRMERDRVRSEKAHGSQSGLVHIPRPTTATVAVEPTPAKSQKKKSRKEPDFFTAAGPGSAAAKKKAQAKKTDTSD